MMALSLLAGFGLLLLGGELLVRGSVGIATKLRISKVVIGLTLVAFATSAPELIVSVVAALKEKSDIALGNVIGSNIANIGLILGGTALLFKMSALRTTYRKDWIFLLVSNALLGVFLYFGGISSIQGGILVTLLIGYNIFKIVGARNEGLMMPMDGLDTSSMSLGKGVLLLILGATGLKFGAQFFVSGISAVALDLGLTERFVSVTLVAFGTSVPELAASLTAAKKGESDIAIGNIIGSNIFNILSVLGFTALIKPITIEDQALFTFDFPYSILLTLLIIPLMGLFKPDQLNRLEGGILLSLYFMFLFFVIF